MTTNDRRRRLRLARLLVLLIATVLLAAACGSDDDGDDMAVAEGEETTDAASVELPAGGDASDGAAVDLATEAAAEELEADSDAEVGQTEEGGGGEEEQGEEGDDALGAGGATVTPSAADLGRKLIFTARVHVEVDDVAAAGAEATKIVQDLGGFVFGQNTTGGTEPSSELVFKVLPDDFNATLEALGAVGELRNQSVSTDDVTERIVDLESRIEVADLGVARLRAALEGAASLEDYAEIERLLLDRESDLEVMRGQLRTLEDRVDLATITLLLTQDRVQNFIGVGISIYEEHNGGDTCPGTGGSRVEAGTAVTVCFDIVNQGDQPLTDITLTDTVLEIESSTELIEVFGSLDELAPGQSVLVAHEFTTERSIDLRTRVVAIPIDEKNGEQAGPSVDQQAEFSLRTFEPDTDPGFTDGFSTAVAILKGLWVAANVVVGFLIPLLVLVPFLWLIWQGLRWVRNRRPPKAQPPVVRPPSPGPGHGPAGPGGGAGPGGSGERVPPPPGPTAASAEGEGSAEQTPGA